MPDVVASRVGGLKLPLTSTFRAGSSKLAAMFGADAGEPIADPSLGVFGRYLASAITAHLGAGWASLVPGVDSAIVKKLFFHDPNEGAFNDNETPSLWVFREGSAKDPIRESDDWTTRFESIRIFWVLPPTDQFKLLEQRRPAMHAVAAVIEAACRWGRDPSFIIPGDPDESAADEGSVLLRHAGWQGITPGRWLPSKIAIQVGADTRAPVKLRDCVDTKVVVEERVEQRYGTDPEDPGAGFGAPFVAPTQAQGVFTVDDVVVAEMLELIGYGMLYVQDGSTAQTIGTVPAKVTGFTSAGPSGGVSASSSEDKLTVDNPGRYSVAASFAVTGTPGRVAQLRLRRNGVEVPGVGGRVTLAAAVATVAVCGIVECAAGDELTVYAEADVDATSLTLIDAAFVIARVN
jgi:hypothetical protein